MRKKPIKILSSSGRSAIWAYERAKPDMTPPPWGVWFAVVCNPARERKALQAIEGLGMLHAYLPVFATVVKVGGRSRKEVAVVERPVFPGYLFVASKLGEFHSHWLQGLNGVERIMRGPEGRPLAIPHEIVAEIMRRDCDGRFDLRPQAARNGLAKPRDLTETGFEAGEVVSVGSGPLAGLTGTIEALASGAKLRVMLDIFGRPTPVDVDLTDLEKVA